MLSPREQGFTLIETIVAMVVLSIVLLGGATMLVNGFAGSNKSLNERRAIQQVDRTKQSLQNTLRAAKSPDREESVLADTQALSGALLAGTPVQGRRSAGGPQVTLDVNDLVYADSNRFIVRSDVLPRAGVECVEYVVVTSGSERSLVRNVWFGSAPGTAPVPCRVPPATTPAPDQTETLIESVGGQ